MRKLMLLLAFLIMLTTAGFTQTKVTVYSEDGVSFGYEYYLYDSYRTGDDYNPYYWEIYKVRAWLTNNTGRAITTNMARIDFGTIQLTYHEGKSSDSRNLAISTDYAGLENGRTKTDFRWTEMIYRKGTYPSNPGYNFGGWQYK